MRRHDRNRRSRPDHPTVRAVKAAADALQEKAAASGEPLRRGHALEAAARDVDGQGWHALSARCRAEPQRSAVDRWLDLIEHKAALGVLEIGLSTVPIACPETLAGRLLDLEEATRNAVPFSFGDRTIARTDGVRPKRPEPPEPLPATQDPDFYRKLTELLVLVAKSGPDRRLSVRPPLGRDAARRTLEAFCALATPGPADSA